MQVGTSADRNVTVKNIGTGTLTGAATTTQPFSIASGGSYSLGSNQSQDVTVRYAPQAAGVNTGTVTFTGGGGASVVLAGSALSGSGSSGSGSSGSGSSALPGLSWESSAGALQSPFVASAGYISQPVETMSPSTGGQATYDFQITNAGNYTISAIVNAPTNGANSFYVNVDAQPTDPTMIWDLPVASSNTNAVVSWRGTGSDGDNEFSPKVFYLSAGVHKLIIRGREANAQLGKITISPAATQPLSLESTEGSLQSPFVASAGYISQPVETLSPSTGGQATYDFQITKAGNYTISAHRERPDQWCELVLCQRRCPTNQPDDDLGYSGR